MNDITDALQLLQIIADANSKNADLAAEHDKIYAGSDGDFESMSDDEKKRMEDWGWDYDEQDESWWTFV